jgi:lipopolysaccharide transport system permease protein
MNRYLEFVWHRSVAEIRADMSRAVLGIFWWIVEPMLYLAVFYVIFGLVFQQRGDNYVSFLLTGLITWKWFASTINSSTTAITRNMPLIYQVYLPKVVFPLVAILTSSFKFLIVFVMLMFFLLITGAPFTTAWLVDLPLLLILQVLFMLGVGMTLAAIDPFLPDIKFLVDNGLLMLFFLSGIFFRFDSVPESIRPYFDLNPMGVLIHNYREILINGGHVDWSSLWAIAITTLITFLLGLFLLAKFNRKYAKRAFL